MQLLLFLEIMRQTVLLFTGHVIDSVDRISARFPYRLITQIRHLIATEISGFFDDGATQVAISSLAAGSDILFAEEVLAAEGALHVFLPHTPQEFAQRSVLYTKNHPDEGPDEWIDRFATCISRASLVEIVPERAHMNPYAACNQRMLEYALSLIGLHKNRVLALAMMESGSELKEGGTAEFADEIEMAGIQVKRLWPYRPHRLYR